MESPIYEQFYRLEKEHWWFRGMYSLCDDMLRLEVAPELTTRTGIVLDIGCGTGCWTERLRSYGEVVALDYAEEALDLCRQRGLVSVIRGDAAKLPLVCSRMDIVTALGLVEHLEDDAPFFREVARVLKPGGYALILTSAFMTLWGEHDDLVHHKRRYTTASLSRAVKASGFEICRMSYVNSFLFLPIFCARLLGRILPKQGDAHGPSPDLYMPHPVLNRLFYAILRIESWLLRRFSLPVGVGLVTVVRRPFSSQQGTPSA